MQSRWNSQDADRFIQDAVGAGWSEALGLRIYTSRLIGQDPDLVLHGGGNTSVKVDSGGEAILHVKGSGWDLDTIEAPGLPAVRIAPLLPARSGGKLSDPEMVALLRANLLDPTSPNPSVEALLHAYLPFNFVDHTHATAILALANQADMRETVARIYGSRLAYVPYVMPGFDLSIEGDRIFRENPDCEGLWLENHGLFTFAATAKASYELMIEFVTLAEAELARAGATPDGPQASDRDSDAGLLERLGSALSQGGSPFAKGLAMDFRSTPAIRRHAAKADAGEIVSRGTVTPDHVIRIKPFPLVIPAGATSAEIDQALAGYIERYTDYFERNAARASEPKTMLDAYPRAVLVLGEGVIGLGANAKAARIAADLLEQSARVMNSAEAYGRFKPISEADLFDMEYWSLEQAKLKVALSG
ncbi:short-chain dehydrogenase [Kaistia algarum]|uniref:class II aldolase n=1 Tax=Kaistia algarum TaxID=2083279 RepID=UPI000CE8B599|nr:class II aldolase [Kaistia algarum]MCX5512586.1 class II aldolase [Kaistia algarum]PPE81891.1 short-chain dehydrogenase [Kaistia algarum]